VQKPLTPMTPVTLYSMHIWP